MASFLYLAMTAAEFAGNPMPDFPAAFMACHFSPYGTGITNIPAQLPHDSILILNDRIPVCGHDPALVASQLCTAAAELGCSGILLDFQRPGSGEAAAVAAAVCDAAQIPVAVSDLYAESLNCPVFLPPAPLHVPLEEHLSPWLSREIWLDTAMDSETVTVTADGIRILPIAAHTLQGTVHWEQALHCHYSISLSDDAAVFTLQRTREDVDCLLEEAKSMGVARAIGLYQELNL